MAILPSAEQRLLPPGVNHTSGGMASTIRGVVLHVIVGSLSAADSAFHNPAWRASAHFGVGKDGRIVQWVDTHDKAWAEAAGNPSWISVESEGRPEEPLTPAQITSVARIFAWGRGLYGYPLQYADSPLGMGLGTHQMGGSAWGGHACPGTIRSNQRQLILNAAGAPAPVPAPKPPPPRKPRRPMFIFQLEGHPHTFVCNLTTARWHVNENDHNTTVWELAVAGLPTKVEVFSADKATRYPLTNFNADLQSLGFTKA